MISITYVVTLARRDAVTGIIFYPLANVLTCEARCV